MFLLDTNVVFELRKPVARRDANVSAWLDGHDPTTFFISVITAFELEIGVLRRLRTDPVAGEVLRDWFECVVLYQFKNRIIPVTVEVARLCAPLHVPNPHAERTVRESMVQQKRNHRSIV